MTDIVHVIRTTTDPIAAPGRAGQHWVNTATSTTWIAKGTGSLSDWILVEPATGVRVSTTDTIAGYLDEKLTASVGTNASTALETSIVNGGGDEDLQVQLDETKLTITASQIPDLTEAAQDAVGAALTDTASVDLTYSDAGNSITATVLPAGVDHNALANYSANRHIDHTAVSINAGSGLTGGGDISATRSISMPDVGTPGTYGSASQVLVLTTDTQGRVTAVTPTTPTITNARTASTSLITTTSLTDVVMTGQTVTPVAGTYIVLARAMVSNSNNGRKVYLSIYSGGVQASNSEVYTRINTGNATYGNADIACLVTYAIVTVNGSQAIEQQWRTDANTAQAGQYGMTLFKVG